MINAIDVSSAQGIIDWKWVADQSIQFAFIECGVGNDYISDSCQRNLQGAQDNNIKPAFYHFIYALPNAPNHKMRDPISQSQYHFDNTPDQCLPVACDAEFPTKIDWAKWGCSANQIYDWICIYMDNYTKLSGQQPMFYSFPSFISDVGINTEFAHQYPKLWIAHYDVAKPKTDPWDNYVVWQTSGGGSMKLNNGCPVDTDFCADFSLLG